LVAAPERTLQAGFSSGRETGYAEALRCTAQNVDRFLKKSGVLDAIKTAETKQS
jgi:hypothetical protein